MYNPLYYCPVEANRLKDGEPFRRLSSVEQTLVNRMIFEKKFARYDEKAKALYDKHDKIYSVHVLLLLCFVFLHIGFIFSNIIKRVYLIFIIVYLVSAAAMLITMVISNRRKRAYLDYLIEDYQPVCTELDEKVLREVGFLGKLAVENLEYFHPQGVPRWEIEGIDLSYRRQKYEYYFFDTCVCMYCGERIDRTEIAGGERGNTAVCPACMEEGMIPCYREISDHTVKKLMHYWNTVRQLKRQFF